MASKRFIETILITMLILIALTVVLILTNAIPDKNSLNKKITISDSFFGQTKTKHISPSPEIYYLSTGKKCDCNKPGPNIVPWTNNQNQPPASPL